MRVHLFYLLILAFTLSFAIGLYRYTAMDDRSSILSLLVSGCAIMAVNLYCYFRQCEESLVDLLRALAIWFPLPLASAVSIIESSLGFHEVNFIYPHFRLATFSIICCILNFLLMALAALQTVAYLRRKDLGQEVSLA